MALRLETFTSEQLRQCMVNAKRADDEGAYNAAFRQLCIRLASERGDGEDDPLALAFWRALYAGEQLRSAANGKTTLLARTRQKVTRVGVVQTIADTVRQSAPSDQFDFLIKAGMPEFLFETLVLDHVERFDDEVVSAARRRLKVGVDA